MYLPFSLESIDRFDVFFIHQWNGQNNTIVPFLKVVSCLGYLKCKKILDCLEIENLFVNLEWGI